MTSPLKTFSSSLLFWHDLLPRLWLDLVRSQGCGRSQEEEGFGIVERTFGHGGGWYVFRWVRLSFTSFLPLCIPLTPCNAAFSVNNQAALPRRVSSPAMDSPTSKPKVDATDSKCNDSCDGCCCCCWCCLLTSTEPLLFRQTPINSTS